MRNSISLVKSSKSKPHKPHIASIASDSDVDWNSRIATAAYFKAEARGFAPGNEIDDWVAAEKDLEDYMSSEMEAESC